MGDRDVSMGSGGIYMSNPNVSVMHFGISEAPKPAKPKPRKKKTAEPASHSSEIGDHND